MVTQQFQNVTPERWLDVRQVMHSDLGLTIEADEGSGESHGIHFAWLFAVPVLTVSITVPAFGWALRRLKVCREFVRRLLQLDDGQ